MAIYFLDAEIPKSISGEGGSHLRDFALLTTMVSVTSAKIAFRNRGKLPHTEVMGFHPGEFISLLQGSFPLLMMARDLGFKTMSICQSHCNKYEKNGVVCTGVASSGIANAWRYGSWAWGGRVCTGKGKAIFSKGVDCCTLEISCNFRNTPDPTWRLAALACMDINSTVQRYPKMYNRRRWP